MKTGLTKKQKTTSIFFTDADDMIAVSYTHLDVYKRQKENIIKTKLLPYFGKRKINEITTKDVIAWQNELLAYRCLLYTSCVAESPFHMPQRERSFFILLRLLIVS